MNPQRVKPPKKSPGTATGRRRLNGAALDVTATAEFLGVTEKQTRARIARGLIPHRIWGGRVITLPSELTEFLAKLPGCTVDAALANVRARESGASRTNLSGISNGGDA